MNEPVPAWLSAWHEARGTQPPTQQVQRAAPAPPPAPAAAPRRAAPPPFPPQVHHLSRGFSVPRPWEYDGCVRREPVLDHDYHPPRVVRRVGWRVCMRCRTPFFSEDVIRLRLCGDGMGCRDNEDRFAQGDTGGSYGRGN